MQFSFKAEMNFLLFHEKERFTGTMPKMKGKVRITNIGGMEMERNQNMSWNSKRWDRNMCRLYKYWEMDIMSASALKG